MSEVITNEAVGEATEGQYVIIPSISAASQFQIASHESRRTVSRKWILVSNARSDRLLIIIRPVVKNGQDDNAVKRAPLKLVIDSRVVHPMVRAPIDGRRGCCLCR